MRITVAITCYNLEDRIEKCLDSVISQDYQDLEILVIDDCSADHSVEVINKVKDNHPEREFRIITSESNQGLNIVRNVAIREARGECLFFIDGDDTIEPGTISLFKHRMELTQVDVVCGSFRKIDFNGNTYIIKQFPEDTLKGDFAFASYIEKYVNGYFNLGVWNNLYRLDFLREKNIFCSTSYSIFEDRLFTFLVVLNAGGVSYIHDITYNYHDYPDSICHQTRDNAILLTYRAINKSIIKAENDFKKSHQILQTPYGIRYLLSYLFLTDGLLKKCMESSASRSEKIVLLNWLKEQIQEYGINWSNIQGPYNRVSYLILISAFPYPFFRFYFKHLRLLQNLFRLFKLSKEYR